MDRFALSYRTGPTASTWVALVNLSREAAGAIRTVQDSLGATDFLQQKQPHWFGAHVLPPANPDAEAIDTWRDFVRNYSTRSFNQSLEI